MEQKQYDMTADELLQHAMKLVDGEDEAGVAEALRIFEFLVNMDRNNRGIVFFLALAHMRQRRYGMAEHLFRRSLDMATAEGKSFPEAHNNLGFVMTAENRAPEAQEEFHKAIAINGEESAFYNNMATLFVNNGTPQDAIDWASKALALAPDDPDAKWNKALAQLELGQWDEAWKGYRAGLEISKWSSGRRKARQYHKEGTPLWDGTAGKTVAVYGEQGVGDEILAASMLPDLAKVCNVIYDAHPRLVDLMRHSFGDLFPIYGTRKVSHILWPQFHEIDAALPIMQLGEFFRCSDRDFPRRPYLKPYTTHVEHYRAELAKLGPKMKIGVSWKGGTVSTRHDLRSVPLDRWGPIFNAIDADWISLQYDPAERKGLNAPIIEAFNEMSGHTLHHWPDVVNDLDECYGGLINALDLVISVNNSIVHACGAYGVPCWSMTPSRPAWRYNVPGAVSVGDDRMIWYGNHVRQFREIGDDWDAVVNAVAEALREWYAEVSAA